MPRRFGGPLSALLLLLAGCQPQASPPQTPSEAAVRDTVRALSRAVDAASDARSAERLIAFFDSSATFVAVAGGVREDFTAFAQGYRDAWAESRPEWEVRHDSAIVTVLGPDAAVSTWTGVSRVVRADGTTGGGKYILTAAWRRGPAGWRIVQMHESKVPE